MPRPAVPRHLERFGSGRDTLQRVYRHRSGQELFRHPRRDRGRRLQRMAAAIRFFRAICASLSSTAIRRASRVRMSGKASAPSMARAPESSGASRLMAIEEFLSRPSTARSSATRTTPGSRPRCWWWKRSAGRCWQGRAAGLVLATGNPEASEMARRIAERAATSPATSTSGPPWANRCRSSAGRNSKARRAAQINASCSLAR